MGGSPREAFSAEPGAAEPGAAEPGAAEPGAACEIPPLDVVYRRYASYVAAIGHQILGRNDEVDDLVQDVFVEAHRGLHRLREPAALKRWLAQVAVRMATRRLRRRRLRRFFRLEDAAPEGAIEDGAASPEDHALVAVVRRTLDGMPARDRVVWVLRHVQEETLESIVALTGQSQSTVQRSLRRSEAHIHAALAGETGRRGGDE